MPIVSFLLVGHLGRCVLESLGSQGPVAPVSGEEEDRGEEGCEESGAVHGHTIVVFSVGQANVTILSTFPEMDENIIDKHSGVRSVVRGHSNISALVHTLANIRARCGSAWVGVQTLANIQARCGPAFTRWQTSRPMFKRPRLDGRLLIWSRARVCPEGLRPSRQAPRA